MNQEIKRKIASYLEEHKKLTLATVDSSGQAVAHTVQYVCEGAIVYFFTKPSQRKVQNLKANPRVGYTVDREYDNWAEIQGVQMLGYAEVIENQQEVERIFALFQERFVPMSKAGKEFLDRHVIVKVSPVEARFIDNTISFGHHDIVSY